MRDVVEVDSCRFLILKVNALHSYLHVARPHLTLRVVANAVQFVDAAFLFRLVLLHKDYLFQGERIVCVSLFHYLLDQL